MKKIFVLMLLLIPFSSAHSQDAYLDKAVKIADVKRYMNNCMHLKASATGAFFSPKAPEWHPQDCKSLLPKSYDEQRLSKEHIIAKWEQYFGPRISAGLIPDHTQLFKDVGRMALTSYITDENIEEYRAITKTANQPERSSVKEYKLDLNPYTYVMLSLPKLEECGDSYAISIRELLSKISFIVTSQTKYSSTIAYDYDRAKRATLYMKANCKQGFSYIGAAANKLWMAALEYAADKHLITHMCGSYSSLYEYTADGYVLSRYRGIRPASILASNKPKQNDDDKICSQYAESWFAQAYENISSARDTYRSNQLDQAEQIRNNQTFK